MKSKIYIEIGYTNFKTKINNNISVTRNEYPYKLLKQTLFNLSKLGNDIYILNNNLQMLPKLLKWQKKLHFFLFDKYKHSNNMKISNLFKLEQMGEDIIFLLDYLLKSSLKNVILMSAGTALVTIIKKDNKINSVAINLGIENQIIAINKKLHWSIKNQFVSEFNLTNPDSAVNLGVFNCVNGTIQQIQNTHKNINYQLVFCGNGFDVNWAKYLLKTYKPLKLDNNLVLNLFSEWVKHNLEMQY